MKRARRPPRPRRLTLVVGTGRVGLALAYAQARYGDVVLLLGRRRGPWTRWAARQGIEGLTQLEAGRHAPDLVLLAVADEALAQVAGEVAAALAPQPRRLVAHVSGLHGLGPLAPFARRGAAVAALHPVLPFSGPDQMLLDLQGAPVTVLAGRGARARSLQLLARWGARPLLLRPGVDRRRYHLGLSLAANHVTALLAWSEALLAPALRAQARRGACRLAAAAVARVQALGPEQALTGP
ncbi:MAG: DUF2520 domain-containing protein, partial [Planctomycetota bacterium]